MIPVIFNSLMMVDSKHREK